jgi:hypothetical protein
MRRRRVTVDLRAARTKPQYRYFKTLKFRYHIVGVKLKDDTDTLKRLISSIQKAQMPVPQSLVERVENPKYFLVHTRVHGRRGVGFDKRVMVPFGLAVDELGAYTEAQKLTQEFAIMIKPKT